jgi:hypothetical protein
LRWTRDDKATVLYDKVNHVLIFTSEEMANAFHAMTVKPSGPADGGKIPANGSPVDGGKTGP